MAVNKGTVNILLVGAMGKMGKAIVQASENYTGPKGEQAKIFGGIEHAGASEQGKEIEGITLPLADKFVSGFEAAEVIIDFSSPMGTELALSIARERKIPIVVCTTGLSDELEGKVRELSLVVPVIRATNTSVVVTVLNELAAQAAKMLGSGFDVELVELHHKMKRDAPSGTALTILEHVAKARHTNLNEKLVTARSGQDALRKEGELSAVAIRGGDATGEHTLYFIGNGERLELTQRSTSRVVYAEGSLRAALWLAGKRKSGCENGYFSMRDVLL